MSGWEAMQQGAPDPFFSGVVRLRKVCCKCERVADPHPTNEFGNLGGWLNTARGWICKHCTR